MKEIKAPNRVSLSYGGKSIFLAGSIEMGTAENWQEKVTKELEREVGYIFNPRRDEWDSTWEQDINNPQFFEQVNWELDMLDRCDHIFMYFDPNTKAPITLLELGMYLHCGISVTYREKLIVCCPKGFWRKGNVDISCQRYGVPCFNNLDAALVKLKSLLYEY